MQQKIHLEIKNMHLKFLEDGEKPLLSVRDLSAEYTSDQRQINLSLQSLIYRSTPILRSMTGQLILDDPSADFPFLLSAQDNEKGHWQLQGKIAKNLDSVEFRHKRIGLPEILSPYLTIIQPQNNLKMLIKLRLSNLKSLQDIDFAIQLIASNLHIQHRALGDDPWGPFPLSFHSAGIWSLSTGQVSIHKGKVFLFPDAKENALRLGFTAKKQDILKDLKQDPWQAVAQIPETPCDTIRAAMPAKALPLADEFRLEGTLALKFALNLISADSSPLDWDPKQQEFNCRPIQVSKKYSRSALTQRVGDIFPEKDQDNPSVKAFLSSEYVPLKQIPEDFFTGIISAEDSSFWSHEGVRLGSLKAALQANLKAGKFVYGASTITMQLVKNLFLNRGKIMSRKVQEIILAWLIEHELEKETILEIYANIVEFGPNIYGIGAASRTFFAKYPEDLTRAEAVYLASVLPNPRLAFEQNVCQGSLHKDWAERMEKTALGIKLMIQDKDWYTHFRKDLSSLRFEDGLKQRFCHLPLANSRDHTTAPRF
jgi:hypothetical protein